MLTDNPQANQKEGDNLNVRLSARLHERKDATLISFLKTLPERERSETVREALRRFLKERAEAKEKADSP
jgi:metal-responsive CopG/Arc/MetJ family transcriptional regulator